MNIPASTPQLQSRTRFRAVLSFALGLLLGTVAQAQELRTATAVATAVKGFVVAVTVTDGGAGYPLPPTVTFSGGGGSGAWAEATVTNGAVDKIVVRGAGSGYTSTPEVVIAAPPPPEAPVIESVRLQSAVTIRGQVGTTNWILAADRLNPPAWQVLTNVVVTSSPYLFVDETASPLQRYYVVVVGAEHPPIPADLSRWVYIPPGTFTMGSPESEAARASYEGPQTRVTLTKGFWLGKYEVTQGEYEAVTGSNPSWFTGDLDRPVERVNWYDATNYCAALTARERVAGWLPTGYEYRLPTEAEWEYACRAGTTTRYSFGDALGCDLGCGSCAQFDSYMWWCGNSGNTTRRVGQKLPNPWGLYDMHGNVWEWCQDWFDTYPGGSVTDPTGPSSGSSTVNRGGSWFDSPARCRSATRGGTTPGGATHANGFRVALVQVP